MAQNSSNSSNSTSNSTLAQTHNATNGTISSNSTLAQKQSKTKNYTEEITAAVQVKAEHGHKHKKHKKRHHRRHHHHKPRKASFVMDDDDIFGAEDNENAEILKSIKYAEKKMGREMGTPKALPRVANRPIMYDVEQVQIAQESLNDKLIRMSEEIEG